MNIAVFYNILDRYVTTKHYNYIANLIQLNLLSKFSDKPSNKWRLGKVIVVSQHNLKIFANEFRY